jgi:hypothetical protein
MLTLLLPMVVWVSFGMLMTRRLLAAPAVGLIAWLFVASGPLIGVAYALRIIVAGDVDADALQGWLAGLGIGGLILALGVRQQAAALHRSSRRGGACSRSGCCGWPRSPAGCSASCSRARWCSPSAPAPRAEARASAQSSAMTLDLRPALTNF